MARIKKDSDDDGIFPFFSMLFIGLLVIAVLFLFGLALWFGFKWNQRYQQRADANNKVKVTQINIRTAEQQAHVVRAEIEATKARAEQRFQESIGIRRAQDQIAKTLTPLYVQHEAIQSQSRGGAGNRIYIPVGPQGIPLVADVGSNGAVGSSGKNQ
jgi:cell division protein FtsB